MDLIVALISPPVRLNSLLTNFQTNTISLMADGLIFLGAIVYYYCVRILRKKGRKWSIWRSTSYYLGLSVIFIATGSGFASYDDSVFFMHVIQHLLLMNLVPILIALSAPITLLLQASQRKVQTKTLKVINSKVFGIITFPLLAWLGNWLTMYTYFLTPIYTLSLKHPLFHDFTHLQFLLVGYNYWVQILGLDPLRHRLSIGSRLIFLLSGIPFGSFLGVAIMQMKTSIAPFAHSLSDTHTGGALLWGIGEIFTFGALTVIFFQWAKTDEREAKRIDREMYPTT